MQVGDNIKFWHKGDQLEGIVTEIFQHPRLIVASVNGKTHVIGYI